MIRVEMPDGRAVFLFDRHSERGVGMMREGDVCHVKEDDSYWVYLDNHMHAVRPGESRWWEA